MRVCATPMTRDVKKSIPFWPTDKKIRINGTNNEANKLKTYPKKYSTTQRRAWVFLNLLFYSNNCNMLSKNAKTQTHTPSWIFQRTTHRPHQILPSEMILLLLLAITFSVVLCDFTFTTGDWAKGVTLGRVYKIEWQTSHSYGV